MDWLVRENQAMQLWIPCHQTRQHPLPQLHTLVPGITFFCQEVQQSSQFLALIIVNVMLALHYEGIKKKNPILKQDASEQDTCFRCHLSRAGALLWNREKKVTLQTVHVSQKAPSTSTFFLGTRKQSCCSWLKYHCVCLRCFGTEVRCCGSTW